MAHTPEFRREAVRLYRVGQRGIRAAAGGETVEAAPKRSVPSVSPVHPGRLVGRGEYV